MVYLVGDLFRADEIPVLVEERLRLLPLPDALKIFMLQVSDHPGTTPGIGIRATPSPLYLHVHRGYLHISLKYIALC